jgi:upstream activation factor subunit UAF30
MSKIVKVKKSATPKTDSAAPAVEVAPVVVTPATEVAAPVAEVATATEVAPSDQDENSVELLFNKLVNQFQDVQLLMKTLQSNLKVLQKEVLKERKESKKKSDKKKNKSDKKRSPSGFAKPAPISPQLAGFLGIDAGVQLARTEVTSKVIAYVKAQNLQNEANKKQIVPDEKLKGLLQPGEGDVVTFFNLQTYLKKHFVAAAPAVVV